MAKSTALAMDLGPLFRWSSAVASHVPSNLLDSCSAVPPSRTVPDGGTAVPDRPGTVPDRPDNRDGLIAEFPFSSTISSTNRPSRDRDGLAEFLNDYRPSHVTPKGGKNNELTGGPLSGPPLRSTPRPEDVPGGTGIGRRPELGRPEFKIQEAQAVGRPTLRPYQLDALAAIRAEFGKGIRSTLVVCPTGTGKTVLFAELGRTEIAGGGRVLVLAHREELLDQARRKFADVGVWAAIEQGAQRGGSAPVVIASVATLHAKRLALFSPSAFTLIIVDEGHHAAAQSYRNVLARFPHARVLLVTATPDRSDGKALKAVCESVAYRYELRAAIADGYLVPLVARRVIVDGVDLSRVTVHHGDFDQGELAAVFGEQRALQGVAVPLLQLSAGRRTIAFSVDVDGAHALAALLNRYEPGVARAVDGSAKREDRAAVLRAFRAGEFRILVNCALYTEGFDEPGVACVAIARPTKSRALHCQMLGRGTRLAPGKVDCLVIDFVGNTGKHSLVGPADALESNDVDAELRAEIERLLSEDLSDARSLDAVIADAGEQLAQKRVDAKFAAVVEFRTKEVDPFLAKFFVGPQALQGERATFAQLAALKGIGIDKTPAALTKLEASRWLGAHADRIKLGFASLKQCRQLERHNIDTTSMRKERAGILMAKLIRGEYKTAQLRNEPEFRAGWKAPTP